jgi:NitT/TauT family transport system permease protein
MSTLSSPSTPSLLAQRVLLVALLLAIWWLASKHMPGFVFPGPLKVADALVALVHTPSFFADLGATLYRVLAGFLIAVAVGAPLGVMLGANPRVARFFEPVLSIVNTVSSAIWAVFAIIWFGISNATTIFVVFMTAVPLILTNVWQGARTVDAQHIELARSFHLSRAQIMRKIFVPTVLPHLFAGARLAFGFGWRVSLVAETIGSSSGIGYRLRQAADLVQTDQVFAWTVTLVVLMLLLEAGVLKPLERWLFRWKRTV